MNINEKLLNIQASLKCKKGQYNSFGKYYYRSCEDILEAAKPIVHSAKCILVIGDEIVNYGDRFYVKATAQLIDTESGEMITNTAYAREELEKKGMDGSQITGTASSYARKYCLNGLFAIDDTKDADSNEYQSQTTSNNVSSQQIAELATLAKRKGVDMEKIVSGYKLESIRHITPIQWGQAMKSLQQRPDVNG